MMKITAEYQTSLIFFVNGQKICDKNIDPRTSLAGYIKNNLNLKGTKIGCNEGGCGACTVMISELIPAGGVKHYSVNACLTPVCAVHGKAVTTVEGIGSVGTKLHPVQDVFSKGHGSQCGYCTPGFIMAMYSLLRNNPQPSKEDIDNSLQGNLCRCTGYRPILESFYTFAKSDYSDMANGETNGFAMNSNGTLNGNGCCGGATNGESCCSNKNDKNSCDKQSIDSDPACLNCDITQDLVFPVELKLQRYDLDYLKVEYDNCCWYKPNTLRQLLELKDAYPSGKLVVGNTEIGVEMRFKKCEYPVLINPTSIPELKRTEITENGLFIGGAVSLSEMETFLKHSIKQLPEFKTKYIVAFVEMLHWFAGKHIRNAASPAGNLMTASPISDLNPLFMATKSVAILQSNTSGRRERLIDTTFFAGYRKADVLPIEILIGIRIPFSTENEHFACYKQAQRREDDIAIVNAGMRVCFNTGTNVISDICLSFGGMAPTTVMPEKLTKQLTGRKWDNSLLEDTCSRLLLDCLPLPPGVPGGMEKFRQSLCLSFFYKFFLTVSQELYKTGVLITDIDDRLKSCTDKIEYIPMTATRVFQEVLETQEKNDSVGRPEMHLSGAKHTTGEAIYCDDIQLKGALCAYFVISTKSYAKLVSVNPKAALEVSGVVAYIDHKDIPKNGRNVRGIFQDEQIFLTDKVTAMGQIIGMVVAETAEIAQTAVQLVKVEYEEYKPIITIEEAIKENQFYNDKPMQLLKGDCEKYFQSNNGDLVVEGKLRVGGQEHFYLETQACLAIPKECDEIEVVSATQNATETQIQISRALGVAHHKVVVSVKRLGGGFGGKETASCIIAVPCAVAAAKLRRPVRCSVERFDDMIIFGTRHPYLCKYKMACNKDGKFKSYRLEMYSNAGYSLDLSAAVMEKSMLNGENVYNIENIEMTGKLCKTNIQSSTAFRAFGSPQSMITIENCITDLAYSLGVQPEELRAKNFFSEGDKTSFNQHLEKCNVRRCWDECMEMSDFNKRRLAVNKFNKQNRWKKRGISLIPTKMGIGFDAKFMNQAGALVHIYKDGSVLISHGGIEMGQGLHTKVAQVATRILGVPLDLIYINDSATDKVPNTTATAASVGSDMYCGAVKNACDILMERLKPVMETHPNKTWPEIIGEAYRSMINLSTNGFYMINTGPYCFETSTGIPFTYFTYGAGCSEVEVDCLTGDHHVIRTDLVMDVGDSLNPAIDIGQVEGAFVQGAGLYTFEELKCSPKGNFYTRGPGTYKIPSADDIAREFNVKLLKGSSNPLVVFSSKAVGEPPLFLGSSIYFAIKDAIKSARDESGLKGMFRLDTPATPERIRLACQDHITNLVPTPKPGTYQPWTVEL